MIERCRKYKGVLIPGCMGVAAAMGHGKSDATIMSYCTCPPRGTADEVEKLKRRVREVERQQQELKKGD